LDEIRQRNLESLGLVVFRFTNEDVRNKIENGLEKINEFIKAKLTNPKIKNIQFKK
jgi:very-short-patch-repair endonuclease